MTREQLYDLCCRVCKGDQWALTELEQSLSQEAVRDEAQIQAEVLAQLLGAAILRLKELGETSWELPPYAKALKREPNAAVAVGPTCPANICLTPKGCALYGCKLEPYRPGASDD